MVTWPGPIRTRGSFADRAIRATCIIATYIYIVKYKLTRVCAISLDHRSFYLIYQCSPLLLCDIYQFLPAQILRLTYVVVEPHETSRTCSAPVQPPRPHPFGWREGGAGHESWSQRSCLTRRARQRCRRGRSIDVDPELGGIGVPKMSCKKVNHVGLKFQTN